MQEIISSRHNPTIVKICKLSDKKHREAQKLFRFDGVKLCAEAIMSGVELEYIFLRRDNSDAVRLRVAELCGKYPEDTGAQVILLENSLFDTVSEEKSPEGIISVAKYIDKFHKIATIDNNTTLLEQLAGPQQGRVLLCESLRDPGNVGAVVRTAYAFGIDWLILSEDCADLYNPKTLRGAMGTLFSQKVLRVDDLAGAVRILQSKGRRVYAAALDDSAMQLGSFPFEKGDCAVIGNEGHGLSEAMLQACSDKVYIPMTGDAESLNASVAAAVLMWEICREN